MPCISPTCDVSDSSWPGSVSNSLGRKLSYHIPLSGALLPTFMPCRSGRPGGELRTGKITGNLQNYGLLRRFWQPVGETIQSLAAKFPEPSEQGHFFVLTGNSSSGTGNLWDRAASCQAAWVA